MPEPFRYSGAINGATTYADGMTEQAEANAGGFLIPHALRADIMRQHEASTASALLVAKYAVHIPLSADLAAEREADRAAMHERIDLNHRLATGTATAEEKAEQAIRAAAYKADREAKHAAAVAEWEALRARYADSPAVLAVLDVHPVADDGLECDHEIAGYEADRIEWPCETIVAIRDAPTGEQK